MRKIATFELVDGDLLKEHLWKYDEEEEVDYYLLSSGYDSNHFQFTFGFPLYVYAYSIIIALILPITNYFRK